MCIHILCPYTLQVFVYIMFIELYEFFESIATQHTGS